VSDPWSEFASSLGDADCAGYFERAPSPTDRTGRATWFTSATPLPTVRTESDLEEVRARVAAHLGRGGARAAMGYLGFDAVGLFEPALRHGPTGSPFPLGEFLLAHDVRVRTTSPRRPVLRSREEDVRAPPRSDSLSRSAFGRCVGRLRREIRSGEAFQVVLAHRREWPRPPDLLERAGRLRSSERYAFFFFLRCGDREVVGASPESVVEETGALATVNPIAGTLPHRDSARRLPLRRDPKELSEHRMLVDLARNDLGRVAVPGTVRVRSAERRVRYARLDHLVSRVEARLRPHVGPWELLASTFPAGTVTGAPKIRATELLRREEATWRGPYGGAVGLLRPRAVADWALAIRTAFASGPRLYTAAGAGIVHASEPAREYDETLAKLAAVEAAVVGGT
jgi:anthranilate/para-aminobenzoate synthase component I